MDVRDLYPAPQRNPSLNRKNGVREGQTEKVQHKTLAPLRKDLTPVQRRNIAINHRIMEAPSVQAIIDVWNRFKGEFNHVNYATAFNCVSKSTLNAFQRQELEQMATEIRDLTNFEPRDLSTTAHAFAKMQIKNDRLFNFIANEVLRRDLTKFEPRHLVNILNAFAKLDIRDERLFEHIAREILNRCLERFEPIDFTNIAAAFAKLDIRNERLFEHIARAVLSRSLKKFEPIDLANIVSAFAKQEIKHEMLFEHIANEVVSRTLVEFAPQDLAKIAYAFAKQEIVNNAFFSHIAEEVLRRGLGRFNSQDLANLASAFAKQEITNEKLFACLAQELCARNLQEFDSQNLANLLTAFDKAEVKNEKLFAHIERELLVRDLKSFDERGLIAILLAFARIGTYTIELVDRLEESLMSKNIEAFPMYSLSLILLSLAYTGRVNSATFSRCFDALKKCSNKSALLEERHQEQLLQVRLATRYEAPHRQFDFGFGLEKAIDDFQKQLESAEARSKNSSFTVSRAQQQVFDLLSDIVSGGRLEVCIEGLDVDICLPQQKVIIEYHGPFHYLQNSQKLDGRTLFKQRLLERMGYRVLIVSYRDWTNQAANDVWTEKTNDERMEVLRKVLEPIMMPMPGEQITKCTAQELACRLNAAAKKGERNKELFGLIGKEILKRGLKDFTPTALVDIVRAFAKMGIKNRVLFHAIRESLQQNRGALTEQELSIIDYAFTKMGVTTELISRRAGQTKIT